jgi:hypothetical protein
MEIANRTYRRNMILYGLLYVFWSAIVITLLIIFQGGIAFSIGWITIWAILVVLTARSMLRMPLRLKLDRKELHVELLSRTQTVRIEDILKIEYNPKDCRMKIISAGGNHFYNDLALDRKDLDMLVEVGGPKGWFAKANGSS